MDEKLSEKYSSAPDYPFVAKAALSEMVQRLGAPSFDGRGMMRRGVIVRHLLLPGQNKTPGMLSDMFMKLTAIKCI